MAFITLDEPQEIDLHQLGEELGVRGVNIGTHNGRQFISADVDEETLRTKVASHKIDKAKAKQREADTRSKATAEMKEREAKREALRKKLGLTVEEMELLLRG